MALLKQAEFDVTDIFAEAPGLVPFFRAAEGLDRLFQVEGWRVKLVCKGHSVRLVCDDYGIDHELTMSTIIYLRGLLEEISDRSTKPCFHARHVDMMNYLYFASGLV